MGYHILILPLLAGLTAQVIKLFLQVGGKRRLSNLLAYSGMPSGHSAIVVSLATIIALENGPDSPYFAIALVLAIIVIRDALGIRRYLGEHGHVLNVLVRDLKDDSLLDEKYPLLLERIGHTPAQVILGSLLGLVISVVGYLLL